MLMLRRIVFFGLICLFCTCFAAAQDKAHENIKQEDLKLLTIGNGKTSSGYALGFRIYGAPDGAKGKIYYAKLDSLPAAQQQIEQWVRAARTVTSRERNLRKEGQLIDERVMATGELPESHEKEFLIIGRDELKCYLIESVSLKVALEIEGLIQHK
jgi:hypothetical protein